MSGGRLRFSLKSNAHRAAGIRERNPSGIPSRNDTREILDSCKHLIVKSSSSRENLVFLVRQRRVHHQHMIGAKSRIKVIEILKASNHERATGKQNDSERDFANDQCVAQPLAA